MTSVTTGEFYLAGLKTRLVGTPRFENEAPVSITTSWRGLIRAVLGAVSALQEDENLMSHTVPNPDWAPPSLRAFWKRWSIDVRLIDVLGLCANVVGPKRYTMLERDIIEYADMRSADRPAVPVEAYPELEQVGDACRLFEYFLTRAPDQPSQADVEALDRLTKLPTLELKLNLRLAFMQVVVTHRPELLVPFVCLLGDVVQEVAERPRP